MVFKMAYTRSRLPCLGQGYRVCQSAQASYAGPRTALVYSVLFSVEQRGEREVYVSILGHRYISTNGYKLHNCFLYKAMTKKIILPNAVFCIETTIYSMLNS